MSLIHEELYRTGETGDVESFDFKAYIQKLANELFVRTWWETKTFT